MGIFGISKEEQAIKQILKLEELTTSIATKYHEVHTEIPDKKRLDIGELVKFVQGDLLSTYLRQVERKDKEAKLFFKEEYFIDEVNQSIKKIYTLCDQLDSGLGRNASSYMQQISKGAKESFELIHAHMQMIDEVRNNNGGQRTKGKK